MSRRRPAGRFPFGVAVRFAASSPATRAVGDGCDCGSESTALRSHPAESGYNLVILMVLVTVLNVAIATALPAWSHLAKRDKEAELVFRGLQYAEAIRVFQQRHGRLPVRLEELVETYPRSLRQLYPDPMSEHGRWGLLVQAGQPRAAARAQDRGGAQQAAPQQPPTSRTAQPSGAAADNQRRPTRARPTSNMVAVPPADEEEAFGRPAQRTTGPIVGVYSATAETGLRTFMGQESYDQWHFHVGLLPTPVLLGDNPAPRVHSGWIGKPFRKDLEVAPPGESADAKRRRALPEDVLGIRDRARRNDRDRRDRNR